MVDISTREVVKQDHQVLAHHAVDRIHRPVFRGVGVGVHPQHVAVRREARMGPEMVGPKFCLPGVRQGDGRAGVLGLAADRLPRERPIGGEAAPKLPEAFQVGSIKRVQSLNLSLSDDFLVGGIFIVLCLICY